MWANETFPKLPTAKTKKITFLRLLRTENKKSHTTSSKAARYSSLTFRLHHRRFFRSSPDVDTTIPRPFRKSRSKRKQKSELQGISCTTPINLGPSMHKYSVSHVPTSIPPNPTLIKMRSYPGRDFRPTDPIIAPAAINENLVIKSLLERGSIYFGGIKR